MIVIGLTGSIGMGKSTVTAQLAFLGAKTSNADVIAHALMQKGGAAVAGVGQYFPSVIENGAVNRKALGAIVFNDNEKLKLLEQVLHPLVVAAEINFVIRQRRLGARLVALDIPLLFETGADRRCDRTLVASAPYFIQRQRVLKRPNMTEQKFKQILRSQMPDREKRRRGNDVVLTGLGKAYSFRTLKTLMEQWENSNET